MPSVEQRPVMRDGETCHESTIVTVPRRPPRVGPAHLPAGAGVRHSHHRRPHATPGPSRARVPGWLVSARLFLNEDGTITALSGKVEEGQGPRAELSQAAAEELRVAVDPGAPRHGRHRPRPRRRHHRRQPHDPAERSRDAPGRGHRPRAAHDTSLPGSGWWTPGRSTSAMAVITGPDGPEDDVRRPGESRRDGSRPSTGRSGPTWRSPK